MQFGGEPWKFKKKEEIKDGGKFELRGKISSLRRGRQGFFCATSVARSGQVLS